MAKSGLKWRRKEDEVFTGEAPADRKIGNECFRLVSELQF